MCLSIYSNIESYHFIIEDVLENHPEILEELGFSPEERVLWRRAGSYNLIGSWIAYIIKRPQRATEILDRIIDAIVSYLEPEIPENIIKEVMDMQRVPKPKVAASIELFTNKGRLLVFSD